MLHRLTERRDPEFARDLAVFERAVVAAAPRVPSCDPRALRRLLEAEAAGGDGDGVGDSQALVAAFIARLRAHGDGSRSSRPGLDWPLPELSLLEPRPIPAWIVAAVGGVTLDASKSWIALRARRRNPAHPEWPWRDGVDPEAAFAAVVDGLAGTKPGLFAAANSAAQRRLTLARKNCARRTAALGARRWSGAAPPMAAAARHAPDDWTHVSAMTWHSYGDMRLAYGDRRNTTIEADWRTGTRTIKAWAAKVQKAFAPVPIHTAAFFDGRLLCSALPEAGLLRQDAARLILEVLDIAAAGHVDLHVPEDGFAELEQIDIPPERQVAFETALIPLRAWAQPFSSFRLAFDIRLSAHARAEIRRLAAG